MRKTVDRATLLRGVADMRSYLATKGYDLSENLLLECQARFLGVRNWHVLAKGLPVDLELVGTCAAPAGGAVQVRDPAYGEKSQIHPREKEDRLRGLRKTLHEVAVRLAGDQADNACTDMVDLGLSFAVLSDSRQINIKASKSSGEAYIDWSHPDRDGNLTLSISYPNAVALITAFRRTMGEVEYTVRSKKVSHSSSHLIEEKTVLAMTTFRSTENRENSYRLVLVDHADLAPAPTGQRHVGNAELSLALAEALNEKAPRHAVLARRAAPMVVQHLGLWRGYISTIGEDPEEWMADARKAAYRRIEHDLEQFFEARFELAMFNLVFDHSVLGPLILETYAYKTVYNAVQFEDRGVDDGFTAAARQLWRQTHEQLLLKWTESLEKAIRTLIEMKYINKLVRTHALQLLSREGDRAGLILHPTDAGIFAQT